MKNEKSFKVIIGLMFFLFIIIVALAIGIGLGYIQLGKKPKNTDDIQNKQSQEDNKTLVNSKSEKIYKDKEYVYTYEKYTSTIYTPSGNVEHTVEIPFININAKEIKTVNSLLQETFKDAKINTKYDEKEQSGNLINIEYSTYTNKDIISVVVKKSLSPILSDGGVINYFNYVIDTKSGEILTEEDIMKHANVTREQIEQSIKEEATKYYNEQKLLAEEARDTLNVDECISKINYGKDSKLYIKDNGKLQILQLNVPSGWTPYSTQLEIEVK